MRLTRRRLLASSSALLSAGCVQAPWSDSKTTVSLGGILLSNSAEQDRQLQLEIRRENESNRGFEVVYENTLTVASKAQRIVDREWATEPGSFTVLYSTGDELGVNTIPGDFEHLVDGDCVYLQAEWAEPEGLTVVVDDQASGFDPEELPACE